MSAVVSLERDQQHLIELRLDSLDRILIDSGVARSERSEIVQSVEDQIFEMLDQQGDEVTRESVLQLLGSLDPPEAYWTDRAAEATDPTIRAARRDAFVDRHPRPERAPSVYASSSKHSGLAIASFVLALISIPMIIIFPVGIVLALAGMICGAIALPSINASGGRLHGTWMAIFGCAVGAVYVVVCLLLIVMNL